MRVPQRRGTKGSLKWIQTLVDGNPVLLADALRAAFGMAPSWQVTWVSPLPSDDWAEYRDADFLAVLGLGRLAPSLEGFWPRGGPQWDALGRSSDNGAVLIEAKSHVDELASSCDAEEHSRSLIERSLNVAKAAFGASKSADWLNGFYQYANRLAHLHFLQQQRVPARLVFVYFIGDAEMRGPRSAAEWRDFLNSVHAALGFGDGHTIPGVCNIFVDVSVVPPMVAA